MIKAVLIDIDGVLTDGRITVDSSGNEWKTINIKDIDAVFEMRRQKLIVGFITGEATPITRIFKERFQPDFFYAGCKDKAGALQEILGQTGLGTENVCYVGDGKYDIPMMKLAGVAACPSDAISEVKALAGVHLSARGGDGCIWELLERLNAEGQI
jgi:YrbI family 3-deoxy-D-manno-octulosonate 8-phosphate phosphatase